jgi:hypothetical protein
VGIRPAGELTWRVGSQCDGGACVAVAILPEAVIVRDSAAPCIIVSVDHAEWREFLARTKGGEFDQQ